MATSRTAKRKGARVRTGGARRVGAVRRAAPRAKDGNGLAALSPDTAERLNALMRSDSGVAWLRVTHAIFACIDALPTHALRIAAFAYVLRTRDVAQYSGDPTPASEYPEFPLTVEEVLERGDRVLQAALREIVKYGQAVHACSYVERMTRAWELVASVRDPTHRCALFERLLESEQLFRVQAVATGSIPYNEPLPDAQWRAMLWRHRDAIIHVRAVTDAMFSDERVRTKGAVGALLLSALERIDDPEARANLFGFILHELQARIEEKADGDNADVRRLVRQLAGAVVVSTAAAAGLPCPRCGKVHGAKGPESSGLDDNGEPHAQA